MTSVLNDVAVQESLHVSFQRAVDAGLFNGIKLDSSLQISHLFYADDAIFMGQWSQCNINTIIRVLDVFYRASGLRINMNKSNLMDISVDSNKVKHAAAKICCLVLKTLFNYVGSRVCDLMSRIQSWHDVTEGMHTRLNPRGGVEQAQFERLKEVAECVTLSNSNDRWSWSLVGSGDFSVSSVRKLIDNVILPKGISKTRWIKEVLIKINGHAWKVIHDCLPTRFNISRRGRSIPLKIGVNGSHPSGSR
nr:RNA-directed DNA polymerase, eukaryota, reverse transcriptase zinc-binding domain protein [Tanacetum cinerariifolium]